MPGTFGDAVLRDGVWMLSGEPHVMMRLRRHFGKAQTFGAIKINDSPSVARDLEWFMLRFPLRISEADAATLARRASSHRDYEERIAAVLDGTYDPPTFNLAIPPRDYQRVGAAMALETRGLLLADSVGLGKSCTAICMLTERATLPALVVTLNHLQRQWRAEIAKFAPTLRCVIAKKGTPHDVTWMGQWPDVLIMNYHKLAGWAEALRGKVRSVVMDECQELRHNTSARYDAAKHVAEGADFRIGMSATPVFNVGTEIFNIMEVLRPGQLGTSTEFAIEWASQDGSGRVKDARAFGAHLRREGLMLRRTREEVGRELPPITRILHTVDTDAKPLEDVQSRATELARLILAGVDLERGEKLEASQELSYLLRQATGVAKAAHVAAFVRLLVEGGEKVVIFAWHRAVYDILMEQLREFSPVLYTGSETPNQKEASKAAFVEGDSKVIIISLRSGQGLDGLQQVCSVCVFAELDWSPAVSEQNEGRVYRDGQTSPVVAYYLVADTGSDPVVMDVLGVKKPQVDHTRDPNASLITALEVDPSKVRKLATDYLGRRGIEIPARPAAIQEEALA